MALRVFGGASKRVAAVDDYVFPTGVRQRLAASRPGLTDAHLTMVEDAARQWFRLHARHPRGARSMPSVLVADWWREFVRHEREYAEFIAAAVGRPVPHAEAAGGVESGGTGHELAVTYRQAREEPADGLPLLFRVDKSVDVPDARRYLADCGGRGQCWTVPGAVCLQHLDGPGRATGGKGPYSTPPPPGWVSSGGDIGSGM
ncbi:hypothetical protein AB0M54_38235 [Actinoplanes sp. NPDC051470]|uniref:hypothetical protein n=1 Tax=Actinoplanes sp. NPDC051470 TaxID=3157224 RepID=UPI00343BC3C5